MYYICANKYLNKIIYHSLTCLIKLMKRLILILSVCIVAVSVFAQTPQTFKYQAVVRDNTGNILANQNVSFNISILQDSTTGFVVYVEDHDAISNQMGLVSLEIGNGTVVSGIFSEIDWSDDIYFLQIKMDETGGTNYQLMGTSQLLSVPYALEAAHASSLTLTDGNGREYEVFIDENGDLVTVPRWYCGDTLTDLRDNQKYLTV